LELWSRRRPVHPWLSDLEGLAPAKALQVASLANTLMLVGPTRRAEAARLSHPLLSQPMMELCLPASIDVLTCGGQDRALAREAFGERLPACVIERLGKGKLTSHYGRGVARGLGQLRPFLLQGRLAQQGFFDLPVLEAVLTPHHLAIAGGFGGVLNLAAVELWVRQWEERLARRPPAAARRAS